MPFPYLPKKFEASKINTKKPFVAANGFIIVLFYQKLKNRHYPELIPDCYFESVAAFLLPFYPSSFYSYQPLFY